MTPRHHSVMEHAPPPRRDEDFDDAALFAARTSASSLLPPSDEEAHVVVDVDDGVGSLESSDAEPPPPPSPSSPASSPSSSALKVLFLSSDTGGGHRASAESLASQFERLYPGSTYHLLDVVEKDGCLPYNNLVSSYKHLSSHPTQWKIVYRVSNTRAYEMLADVHLKLTCERAVRKRIKSYDPDVVISVHPLMTNVPVVSCRKISQETGRHLPMFTVVTDLGSAHSFWFASGVERMFVASEHIKELATARGKVPEEKLVVIGLPIRSDFALQSDRLGDRTSDKGKSYQRSVREGLGLTHVDRKTVLVMGGGEGVGSLSSIVDALYVELANRGIDANLLVVCGRNDKLRSSLDSKDWNEVLRVDRERKECGRALLAFGDLANCLDPAGAMMKGGGGGGGGGCIEEGRVTRRIRKILSAGSLAAALRTPLPVSVPPSANNSDDDDDDHDVAKEEEEPEDLGTTLAPTIEDDDEDENERTKSSSSNLGEILRSERFSDDDAEDDNDDGDEERILQTSDSIEVVEGGPPPPPPPPAAAEEKQLDVVVVDPASSKHDIDAFSPDKRDDHRVAAPRGKVDVVPLGFVTRMAEYMVSSDVLVTKAGPGTIAEAASVSLPVVLTSFLPGQEEGNVDYVVEKRFGTYVSDADPSGIAEEVVSWLLDKERYKELSRNAREAGAPNAAEGIARSIGDSALRWKEINREMEREGEGGGSSSRGGSEGDSGEANDDCDEDDAEEAEAEAAAAATVVDKLSDRREWEMKRL